MRWALFLFLIIGLVLFFGCRHDDSGDDDDMIHPDDDDDDGFGIGDDDAVDDDAVDDDAAADMSCAEAYAWLYVDCEKQLTDRRGDPFPLEDVIRYCQRHDMVFGTFIPACIEENYPDCDAAFECIEDLAGGDDDDDTGGDDDTLIDDYPALSDGRWDPPTTELMEISGYNELWWASALVWAVCDEGNNLLPNGEIFFWAAGTSTPFLAVDIYWADLHNPPDIDLSDVDNCDYPVEVGIIILFGPEYDPPPPGMYCCDIEATDTQGNFSNLLTNLCVTHDP